MTCAILVFLSSLALCLSVRVVIYMIEDARYEARRWEKIHGGEREATRRVLAFLKAIGKKVPA